MVFWWAEYTNNLYWYAAPDHRRQQLGLAFVRGAFPKNRAYFFCTGDRFPPRFKFRCQIETLFCLWAVDDATGDNVPL